MVGSRCCQWMWVYENRLKWNADEFTACACLLKWTFTFNAHVQGVKAKLLSLKKMKSLPPVFSLSGEKLVEVSRYVKPRHSNFHLLSFILKAAWLFKGVICILWSIYIYKQTPAYYLCMLLPSCSIIHSVSLPERTQQAQAWELSTFQDDYFPTIQQWAGETRQGNGF